MKYKKWLSLCLAVMMAVGMAVPALASEEPPAPAPVPEQDIVECGGPAEEPTAPPPAMAVENDVPEEETAPVEEVPVEEAAPVEEASPVEEEAPAEEAPVPEETGGAPETVSAEPEDAPEAASFALPTGGVSVTISGPMSAIDELSFFAPGGGKYDNLYNILSGGVFCWYDPDHDGLGERVNVTTDRPSQFCVYPGTEMVVLMDPNYDVTISSGSVERNIFYLDHSCADNGIDQRLVNLTAPASGSMTITVSPITKPLPRKIPFTSYGGGSSGGFECAVVHDEKEFGFWCLYEEDMTGFGYGDVYTGTTICFELKPGYTIEVLKGGKVTRVGGFFYPTTDANAVGVDIRVDDDATEFCYAIVKQGEHFTVPERETSGGFIDVAADSWYAATVAEAVEKGVVVPDSTGRFSPNSSGTRGQTVTMLYRAMGCPAAGSGAFSDTTGEVASAASWAASAGITKGVTSSAFAPDKSITREQLVTMLYRMAGSPAADSAALASYSDGSAVHDYAASAVAWALQNGVLTGYGDGSIRPNWAATRAEICALVMRFAG